MILEDFFTRRIKKLLFICPAGSFLQGQDCSLCVPGTFQDTPEQNLCKPCLAGHFCPGNGEVAPTPCHSGTFEAESGQTVCSGSCPVGSIGTGTGKLDHLSACYNPDPEETDGCDD